jgi:hypothetical protein
MREWLKREDLEEKGVSVGVVCVCTSACVRVCVCVCVLARVFGPRASVYAHAYSFLPVHGIDELALDTH